jgi:signal transduction histidine kinase
LDYARRANRLGKLDWNARQRLLQSILLICLAALLTTALVAGHGLWTTVLALVPGLICLVGSRSWADTRGREWLAGGGVAYGLIAAVTLSRGTAETHLLFLIVIAFVAACAAVLLFASRALLEHERTQALTTALAEAEINRRKLASEVLATLDRRNQSLLYRQLDIINRLAERERDPDALAELLRLDHLATRIRRNSESLLVLTGEEPPSTWSEPVPLLDVVRDAIAETEDLERVAFSLDARLALLGQAAPDVTHLLGELIENAVRFSPPQASAIVRIRPHQPMLGAHVLTIEDSGIGIRPDELKAANQLLAWPREVDLAATRRLGLHVVSRLAARHGIHVLLSRSPGSGVTASVALPLRLFADPPRKPAFPATAASPAAARAASRAAARAADRLSPWPAAAPSRPAVSGRVQPAVPALPAPRRAVGGSQTRGAHERGAGLSFELSTDFGVGDQEPWSGWWEPLVDTEPERPSSGSRASAGGPSGRSGRSGLSGLSGPPAAPSPGERPAAPDPVGGPAGPRPTPLARRVPQSHLAPELREGTRGAQATGAEATGAQATGAGAMAPQATGSRATSRGDATAGDKTREALSRYQASRRAARALLGDDAAATEPDLDLPDAFREASEPSGTEATDRTDPTDRPDRAP